MRHAGKANAIMRRLATCLVLAVMTNAAVPQEAGAKLAIEDLLKSGWQIAGYTGAVDNWSTFILLRHPSETHLIQCRAGYDVTREPRVQTNCYRLR
jgi:hypothetical protein